MLLHDLTLLSDEALKARSDELHREGGASWSMFLWIGLLGILTSLVNGWTTDKETFESGFMAAASLGIVIYSISLYDREKSARRELEKIEEILQMRAARRSNSVGTKQP